MHQNTRHMSAKGMLTLGSLLIQPWFTSPVLGQTVPPTEPGLVCHWSFDSAPDKGSDTYAGNSEAVPGVCGRALKLDGYTACVERTLGDGRRFDGGLTVEAWIALAGYPWQWSPIADGSRNELTGFFFGINHEGMWG